MFIQCPNCLFAKETSPEKIPPGATQIKCPKCGTSFPFIRNIDDKGEKAASTDNGPKEPAVGTSAPSSASVPPQSPQASSTQPPSKVVPFRPRTQQAGASQRLSFKGEGKTLLGIYIVNVLLNLVTLNIYHFWGKVRVRKYLYGNTELMGERFSYTGTGMELFKGWFKASIIFLIGFGIPQVLASFVHPALGALAILVFPFLIPFALVSARRYRLSRSFWRGVQFSFMGTVKEGLKLYIKGVFLSIITLGFYGPYFYVNRQSFWRNNTRFGSLHFKYTGDAREIKKAYYTGLLLTALTLGVYWFWHSARLTRYDWAHTAFDGVSFSSDVTGGKYFKLIFVNLLLIVCTLGIALPWVKIRSLEFVFNNLEIKGAADFETIKKTSVKAQAVGEGLLGELDIDIGL